MDATQSVMPKAVHVEALAHQRLAIRFEDGVAGVVDLGRAIAATPDLAPLKDPAFFAKVAVIDGGAGIGWPGDLAIDARAQRSRIGDPAGAATMTPADLERAGELLFGRNWKTELAEALGINDPARLRAMMRGDRPVPEGFSRDIAAMLRERARGCATFASALEN